MSRFLVAVAVLLLMPSAAHAGAAPYAYSTLAAASVGPAPACVDPEPVPMRSGMWAQASFSCPDATSFSVVEATHGAVRSFHSYGSYGSVHFEADQSYSGEATVKLLATNAEGTDELLLRFAVSPTYNRPPVCEDRTFDIRLGSTRTTALKCTDPDWDPISFTRTTVPAHGAAGVPYSGSSSGDGSIRYRAPASTDEPLPLADAFTVTGSDGYGGSDTITVAPTVQPASFNQAPVSCYASGGLWGMVAHSGKPRSFYVSCTDPDGDALSYSVTTPPASPGATLAPQEPVFEGAGSGGYVYTPAAGYTGSDSFTITATDGHANVAVPVTFEVTEPPGPTCQTPQVERVRPGRTRKLGGACTVQQADGFPAPASYEIVDPPDHGTLLDGDVGRVAPEPGATGWTYKPAAGVSSAGDSFTYVATANGKSAPPVTQQIEIDPQANRRPYCFGPDTGSQRLRASQTRRLRITCSDEDGDPLTITTDDPEHGTVVQPAQTGDVLEVTYDPDEGYLGQDVVTWHADDGYPDGTGGQPHGQHTYTVVADEANTKPYCESQQVFPGPRAGGRYTVTVSCSDLESDPLTLETSDAVNGTIVSVTQENYGQWTSFRVVVEGGSEGDGSFTARAHDGREAGNSVTYGFPVRAADANSRPFCWLIPPFAMVVDAAKPFELPWFGNACSDVDQDPLDMRIHAEPAHGTLAETDTGWTYTPEPGYSGPDEFAISVTDGRSAPLVVKLLLKVYATDEVHTTLTGGPQGETKARTATFQFTSPMRPDAGFECRLDAGEWTACSPGVQYGDLGEGEHEFEVRAVQGAEKDATPAKRRWKVDLTGPPAPALGGAPAAQTSAQAAAFTFTGGADAAGFECRLDGGEFAACTSPKQLTGLADGEHTFSVRGLDALGNAGAVSSHTWTVDTVAPETLLVAGPSGETAATTAAFSFAGGPAYECRLDGGEFAPCASPAVLTGLAATPHTFAVRAVDAAGNADATPATRAWTVVTAPPAVETVEGVVPAGGGAIATPSVALTVPATAAGGPVSIRTAAAPTQAAPAGFSFLGRQFTIEAPVASAERPLRLAFDVDAATLATHGLAIDTVQVFRDGAAIVPCTGPAGHAVPDVCVAERVPAGDGAARLVVLSTHASTWNLGARNPDTPVTQSPKPPQKDGRAPAIALSAAPQRIRTVIARGLRVTAGCDEICGIALTVALDARTASKLRLRGRAARIGTATVISRGVAVIRLPRKVAAKLKKARSAVLKVSATAMDPAGNGGARTIVVKLRR